MKVGIVTVYNTENSGSALQAYALKKVLQKQGHDVYFIHRPIFDTNNAFIKCIIQCIYKICKFEWKAAKLRWIRRKEFKKFQHNFNVKKKRSVLPTDTLVYGSDTLWNIESKYFSKRRKLFWGELFPNNIKITYAISIANTDAKMFQKDNYYRKNISNFDRISVRDTVSKNAISAITEKEIVEVLDPTLLLDKEDYDVVSKEVLHGNFLLIYYFGRFSEQQKQKTIAFAKAKNLKLVSLAAMREWCDFNFPITPSIFIDAYSKAEYVITNTFHGSCFSVIYEKRFIAFVNHSNKAKDVLIKLKCEERMVDEEMDYISILSREFDYRETREVHERLKERSIKFLLQTIQS